MLLNADEAVRVSGKGTDLQFRYHKQRMQSLASDLQCQQIEGPIYQKAGLFSTAEKITWKPLISINISVLYIPPKLEFHTTVKCYL